MMSYSFNGVHHQLYERQGDKVLYCQSLSDIVVEWEVDETNDTGPEESREARREAGSAGTPGETSFFKAFNFSLNEFKIYIKLFVKL